MEILWAKELSRNQAQQFLARARTEWQTPNFTIITISPYKDLLKRKTEGQEPRPQLRHGTLRSYHEEGQEGAVCLSLIDAKRRVGIGERHRGPHGRRPAQKTT